MRVVRYAIIGLLLAICVVGCDSKPDAYDSYGDVINLSDYKGKWVIVNYWASWCEPCYTEMPVLQLLADNYSQNLVVLGINFEDATDSHLQRFAHQHHIRYPLVTHFPMQKLGIASVDVLPTTVILNPKGKPVATLLGPQTKQQLLQAMSLG